MGWGKFIAKEIGKAAGEKVKKDTWEAKKNIATDKKIKKKGW